MRLFRKYLRPFYGAMIFGLVIKIVGTVMDLFIPRILQYLIDKVAPQEDKELVLMWGGIMIVCSVTAIVANIIANRMAAAVARDFIIAVRNDLFKKTIRLSSSDADKLTLPTLETRLTSDTYNIHQFVGMIQRIGVRAPILLLGGIVSSAIMEPVLTLVLLVTLPLIAVIFSTVSKKGIKLFTDLQTSVDALVRCVRENIKGMRVVKALSKEDFERKKFSKINDEVYSMDIKSATTTAKTNPLMSLCLNIGLTLVVLVGAFRVSAGVSTPAKIMVFLTYFTIILNAMMTINRLFVMYTKGVASAKRITEILQMDDEPVKSDNNGFADEKTENIIEFKHVSFAYNGADQKLSDISFSIKDGSTLGIIGATGSGKTTVAGLMMRFYDADSGEIFFKNKNVKDIDIYSLRKRFGFVQQNDMIIADTIYENIRFGRDIDLKSVENAAKTAQAYDFIENTEQRFDTLLTAKGTNISGGQKQRIYIARAVSGDPDVLILDDSSSALDYKTDALLRRELRNARRGKTLVIIAQRISSVKNCDKILVMDNGRIIASGTHDELLEDCEIYREISASQMGGEMIDR